MASESRRSFMRRLATGSALALGMPGSLPARGAGGGELALSRLQTARVAPNDSIQLAIIGAGGMGSADVNTALSIPGVRLVAACDLYDGRLAPRDSTTDAWPWADLVTTRDYREILARDDIDAVICATPDHWHRRISVDAMEAGKAVYCEKPMVHAVTEGADVVAAQRRTGRTFQVGSQGMSSLGNEKAKELYEAGAIGELNYAEGFWARNSPVGAWQYAIPDDASEETVDFDRFLGTAPKVPFDPVRFFRWRNYNDYGTGVSGDLFVHLFSSLHFIVSSLGPTKIMATGGLRYWKDGRDAPDVVLGMFDYPATDTHPPFNLSLRVNFVDGTSGSTVLRLVGHEGAMDVTWTDVIVRKNKVSDPTDAFSQMKETERRARYGERKEMLPPAEMLYQAEDGYWGAHVDHFMNFFEGIRSGHPVVEDAVFGYRAAAPALLCNDSLFQGRIMRWNPTTMTVVGA